MDEELEANKGDETAIKLGQFYIRNESLIKGAREFLEKFDMLNEMSAKKAAERNGASKESGAPKDGAGAGAGASKDKEGEKPSSSSSSSSSSSDNAAPAAGAAVAAGAGAAGAGAAAAGAAGSSSSSSQQPPQTAPA